VALQLGLLASNICAFDFPSWCVITVVTVTCYFITVVLMMLSDPSDRVALKLGLSDICAFDFPSRCVITVKT
jgi:hypothetical protein